jgi:protein involved in polysaccharide export with SLBB domain
MLDSYDLSPQALPEIPDDPPPHEGAMVDLPAYRIEPPDLILVEVLEALPARPISGERLVRPDGTITLGFYGSVHIRGLTIEQARVKITKHLRHILSDEILGLRPPSRETLEDELEPNLPADDAPPEEIREDPHRPAPTREKLKATSRPGESAPAVRSVQPVSGAQQRQPLGRGRRPNAPGLYFGRHLAPPTDDDAHQAAEEPPASVDAKTEDGAEITVRINVKNGNSTSVEEGRVVAPRQDVRGGWGERSVVPPDRANRVFVDVTAYNSKLYYVLGEVASPGSLPITGNETVLQAVQYAGGLLPTADAEKIHVVRPGRDGKPARTYKVNLLAIERRGETATNYQLFPGDRIVVGANELGETKAEIERLAAKVHERTLREKLEAPKAGK